MSVEHNPATPPDPDDFDRQLRELTSGQAGAARFREPSAQERAKQAAAKPGQRRDSHWRSSRKARQLRRPVGSAGGGGRQGSRSSWRGKGARAGSSGRRPTPSSRQQRLRSAAKTAGILIAFVALIVVLHLLGFGPQ